MYGWEEYMIDIPVEIASFIKNEIDLSRFDCYSDFEDFMMYDLEPCEVLSENWDYEKCKERVLNNLDIIREKMIPACATDETEIGELFLDDNFCAIESKIRCFMYYICIDKALQLLDLSELKAKEASVKAEKERQERLENAVSNLSETLEKDFNIHIYGDIKRMISKNLK